MNFWTLSNGSRPTGSAGDANVSTSMIVPNDTMAKAKIDKFENVEMPSGDKLLVVNWKLEDTSYKGLMVNQKLKVFDENPAKRDRALNMLARLYKLSNLTPAHDGPPSNEDLAKFKGRMLGIKVQQWFYNGKEGNWVSEVHSAESFVSEDGIRRSPPQQQQSMDYQQANEAYKEMAEQAKDKFDDDIPF